MSGPDDPDDPDRAGGFLSGWSRRKQAARREAAQTEEPAPDLVPGEVPDLAPDPVPGEAVPAPDAVDDDAVTALPTLDQITATSDIKPFLARGIPANLRNAALRRLWSVSPAVRDYADPAVDYAWDWNAPGGVPGGGGTLTPSGVAKMVRDLIGGKQDPAPGEAAPTSVPDGIAPGEANGGETTGGETTGGETTGGDAPDDPPARPETPSSVRLSNKAEAAPNSDGSDRQPPERTASLGGPVRRHGGAMPQ